MNTRLHTIMIIASLVFLLYIAVMIRKGKLELKYALAWLFAGTFLLSTAIFPELLNLISGLLNIIEPVNTLFLLVIFFILLIIFTLTIAVSRYSNRVKTITQEMGIMKMQFERHRKNPCAAGSNKEKSSSKDK